MITEYRFYLHLKTQNLLKIHSLAEFLSDDCLELLGVGSKAPDAGAELLHGHLVHIVKPAEAGLVQVDQGVSRGVSTSHALDLHSLGHPVELGKELGADGEGVTAAEGEHLPGVPEAGSHHNGLVSMLLVVAEDLPDTLDARILLRIFISLPGLGLVIVHNSSDEWRNQGDLCFGACNGLGK